MQLQSVFLDVFPKYLNKQASMDTNFLENEIMLSQMFFSKKCAKSYISYEKYFNGKPCPEVNTKIHMDGLKMACNNVWVRGRVYNFCADSQLLGILFQFFKRNVI